MAKYWGVKCGTCEEIIILDPYEDDPAGSSTVKIPPLEPIPCSECGSSHSYGSDDVRVFDV
jgi:hypothetical protein